MFTWICSLASLDLSNMAVTNEVSTVCLAHTTAPEMKLIAYGLGEQQRVSDIYIAHLIPVEPLAR